MNNPLTLEDKLKAIIQAQYDGGYDGSVDYLDKIPSLKKIVGYNYASITAKNSIAYCDVLNILLGTKGLKAAYPGIAGEEIISMVMVYLIQENHKDNVFNWHIASWKILEAWNSGEGNNYKAAINMEYDLLNSLK